MENGCEEKDGPIFRQIAAQVSSKSRDTPPLYSLHREEKKAKKTVHACKGNNLLFVSSDWEHRVRSGVLSFLFHMIIRGNQQKDLRTGINLYYEKLGPLLWYVRLKPSAQKWMTASASEIHSEVTIKFR